MGACDAPDQWTSQGAPRVHPPATVAKLIADDWTVETARKEPTENKPQF
jgi:hypothetical protein